MSGLSKKGLTASSLSSSSSASPLPARVLAGPASPAGSASKARSESAMYCSRASRFDLHQCQIRNTISTANRKGHLTYEVCTKLCIRFCVAKSQGNISRELKNHIEICCTTDGMEKASRLRDQGLSNLAICAQVSTFEPRNTWEYC